MPPFLKFITASFGLKLNLFMTPRDGKIQTENSVFVSHILYNSPLQIELFYCKSRKTFERWMTQRNSWLWGKIQDLSPLEQREKNVYSIRVPIRLMQSGLRGLSQTWATRHIIHTLPGKQEKGICASMMIHIWPHEKKGWLSENSFLVSPFSGFLVRF